MPLLSQHRLQFRGDSGVVPLYGIGMQDRHGPATRPVAWQRLLNRSVSELLISWFLNLCSVTDHPHPKATT